MFLYLEVSEPHMRELYRLRAKDKKKQIAMFEWLKKYSD
jgi:hypothetical protein